MFIPALAGQGFVVADGTCGVGRAVVVEAARRGAQVVFCGHEAGDTVGAEIVAEVREIEGAGQVTFVPVDLSAEASVDRLFDVALEQLPALHVVVHNLASAVKHDARPLIELSLADWNAVLDAQLKMPFWLSRRAIQEFLAAGEGGRLVHILPDPDETPSACFATAHTAFHSFVRSIAKEYGRRGMACNGVVLSSAEGSYLDDRANAGSSQQYRAVEAAELVLFLASAEASFVNGEIWPVA
jgi:3-oxoacyl-[acyl-carrier protein] reductase